MKVWLNGELIHANNVARSLKRGEDKVDVSLKDGENLILIKVIQGAADWAVCFRFMDPEGGALQGLKVTTP